MFKMFVRIASPLALASLAVPALANPPPGAFSSSSNGHETRASLFAGLTIRVGLDGRRERSPEVVLRFAGATHDRGMRRIGEGLALTASSGGKPRLTLGGQDSATAGKQLGLSETGKTALIIAGVVVVAVGIGFLIVKHQLHEDMEGDRVGG